MRWTENAYVKLVDEENVRQIVTVALADGWVHIQEPDAGNVVSYPSSRVEFVRWPLPVKGRAGF